MKLYYSSGTVIAAAAAVRLIYGGTGAVCVEQYCSTGGTGEGRGGSERKQRETALCDTDRPCLPLKPMFDK